MPFVSAAGHHRRPGASWNTLSFKCSAIIAGLIDPVQSDRGEITVLLNRLASGDKAVEETLLLCVYAELHRIAGRCLQRERRGHTLQATALVNEAYLRLCQTSTNWQNRVHFFAVSARIMRRILTDYARARKAVKRNEGARFVDWDEACPAPSSDLETVIFVDATLNELAKVSPRQAQVVEMRYFAGMTEDEIAAYLGISCRTVRRDWLMARAWLLGTSKEQ